METKKPKPNVFIVLSQVVGEVGLAAIEFMRTDSEYALYRGGVDDRVDSEIIAKFSKNAGDPPAVKNLFMLRLIAKRATLYCKEILSINIDHHVEQLRDWFFGLVLFAVAVLVFLGLTTATPLRRNTPHLLNVDKPATPSSAPSCWQPD